MNTSDVTANDNILTRTGKLNLRADINPYDWSANKAVE